MLILTVLVHDSDEPFRPPSRAEIRPEDEPEYAIPGAPTTSAAGSGASRPYARCIFLMRARRTPAIRRPSSRQRLTRRYLFRGQCPTRIRSSRNLPTAPELPEEDSAQSSFSDPNMPTLLRRLEHYLLEHARLMGQSISGSSGSPSMATDVGEYLLTLRLNNCRIRANSIFRPDLNSAHVMSELRNDSGTVSRNGRGRYGARQTLVFVIDVLLRFSESHRNEPFGSVRTSHLLEYVELSLLLSEVLLLQIVDTVSPPPRSVPPNREDDIDAQFRSIM